MQYVNTPVSPRIAWLPLALPASYWLKRYHCLFCKHWAMFVSKVTVFLLLLCRKEGGGSWFKHLGASCATLAPKEKRVGPQPNYHRELDQILILRQKQSYANHSELKAIELMTVLFCCPVDGVAKETRNYMTGSAKGL